MEAAKRLTPFLVFFVGFILALVLVFKGLKNLNLHLELGGALLVACGVGLFGSLLSWVLVRRIGTPESQPTVTHEFNPMLSQRLKKARKHLTKIRMDTTGDMNLRVARLIEEVEELRTRAESELKVSDGPDYRSVERIFIYLQILSACFVAFAHGANDVANAIGPLSAVISTLKTGIVGAKASVPLWALALGGVGIVVGLATWGWRVIETIGRKITELTPSRGFAAEFGAATTIVVASRLGLPISTTHTLVGAVLGVGMARGMGALNLNALRSIAVSWVVTIPAGALITVVSYYTLSAIF